MGAGRRWAVDLTDNSTSPSSRDVPDPPGFSRTSLEQVLCPFLSFFLVQLGFGFVLNLFDWGFFVFLQDDSTVSRQKKDAESTWKAQVFIPLPKFTSIETLKYLGFFAFVFQTQDFGHFEGLKNCTFTSELSNLITNYEKDLMRSMVQIEDGSPFQLFLY